MASDESRDDDLREKVRYIDIARNDLEIAAWGFYFGLGFSLALAIVFLGIIYISPIGPV